MATIRNLLLFCAFFGLSACALVPSQKQIRPIFSSNSTLVQLGQTFNVSCTLFNFVRPSNAAFSVNFFKDDSFLAEFNYPTPTAEKLTPEPNILLNRENRRDIQILSTSHSISEYHVTVLAKSVGKHAYTCAYASLEVRQIRDQTLSIEVVAVPKVTLKPSVTKPIARSPFTLSCALSSFKELAMKDKAYQVAFFSSKNGLLASYQITHQTILITEANYTDVKVLGKGTVKYEPVFEVILTEKSDSGNKYWCTFEEANLGSMFSPKWPVTSGPEVVFSSTKVNSTTHVGTCTVEHFVQTGKSYSVQFWTDVGPNSADRLAEYVMKPENNLNYIPEFQFNQVSGWAAILPGDFRVFPTFSIQVTGDSAPLHGNWWCVLGVNTEGSSSYSEVKSSSVALD